GPASSLRCCWYSSTCPIWICASNSPPNTLLKFRMYHPYISMVLVFRVCSFLISSQCCAASSKHSVRNSAGLTALNVIRALPELAGADGGEPVSPAYLGCTHSTRFVFYSLQQNIALGRPCRRIYGVCSRNGAVVSHGEIKFPKALKIEHVRVAASTRRQRAP